MNQLYTIQISRLDSLYRLVNSISRRLTSGIVFLHGDLGVGKTAFVQMFIKSLGYRGKVTSPSYGIINEYQVASGISVIHADLYRLSEPQELLYLDVDEWIEMANILFIEWPEKGGDYLPKPDLDVFISMTNNHRLITMQFHNTDLEGLLCKDGIFNCITKETSD